MLVARFPPCLFLRLASSYSNLQSRLYEQREAKSKEVPVAASWRGVVLHSLSLPSMPSSTATRRILTVNDLENVVRVYSSDDELEYDSD